MSNQILVTLLGDEQKRIVSENTEFDFASVRIGASKLKIDESTGKLNLNNVTVIGVVSGVADDSVVVKKQMEDYVADQIVNGPLSEWYNSAIDILGTPPGGEAEGDRYLVSGTLTGAFSGHQDDIAEWMSGDWVFTTPTTGAHISVDDETDGIYYFGGSSWVKKYYEGTTASNGLEKVGLDVRAKLEASNPTLRITGSDELAVKFEAQGLAQGSNGLALQLDGSTLSKSGSGLKVGVSGITATELAASVAGDGLVGGNGTALAVGAGNGISVAADSVSVAHDGEGLTFSGSNLALELDGSTLSKSASGVKVSVSGITATELAASVAGDGLAGGNGTPLSVNVDNSTIEISADVLRVKDAGITSAKLAAAVAGNGLTGGAGSALAVGAGEAIEVTADTVAVDYTQTKTNNNGSTITIRKVVFVKTNGQVAIAAATNSLIAGAQIGLVQDASINDESSGKIVFRPGKIMSGYSGLTPGYKQYVSISGGDLMEFSSISGLISSGNVLLEVGKALSSTELLFQPGNAIVW